MKTLLCLLLCCVFWQHAYAVVNVAIGGSAVQSSSESTGRGAEQSIDGNRDHDPSTGSCSSTSCSDTDSYWIVCLGDTYTISAVTILTPNTTSYSLDNIKIEVFATDPRITTAIGTECGTIDNNPVSQATTATVSCANPIDGKYVKITTIPQPPSWPSWRHHGFHNHGWKKRCVRLFFCEVEVEATPICKTGFISNNDSCYHVSTGDTLSWVEAMSYCRARGADLAILDSAAENEFMKAHIMSLGSSFQVDAYSIGFARFENYPNFTWLDDNAVPLTTFEDWGPNEPQTTEHCSALWRNYQYKWADILCDREERFICEYNAKWPRVTKNDCYCDSARRT